MLALFWGVWHGFSKQKQYMDDILNVRFKMSANTFKIKSDILDANKKIYQAISWARADYDRSMIEQLINENKSLRDNTTKLLEGIINDTNLTPEEKKLYTSCMEIFNNSKATTLVIMNSILIDVNVATMELSAAEEDFKALEKAISDLTTLEDKLSKDKYNSALDNSKLLMKAFTLAAFASVIITFIINIIVSRFTNSTISKTISVVNTVARDGDLSVAIDVASNDEIGQLARAVETMREKMEDAVGQASFIAGKLAESSSEGAASIEETSASLNEVSCMIAQNAQNTSQVNGLLSQAEKEIKTANDQMESLTASMSRIGTASERAQQIVKNIDGIAFQTNLLALNAAVEAARAGESGAGFAVVADEVRNLAMRATEAAKNTSELISDIVTSIKQGNDTVTTTSQVFGQVLTSTNSAVNLMEHINTASHEQTQGIDNVNKAVQQLNTLTQQNAESAQDLAASMAVFKTRHNASARKEKTKDRGSHG
jgi:methyl-accepting chemotaxis protein